MINSYRCRAQQVPVPVPVVKDNAQIFVTILYLFLWQVCPMLDNGPDNTYACCSMNQLNSLEKSLSMSKAVLIRCPSCAENFAHLHCMTTCSPNQTQSLQVTKVMNITNDKNLTREAVVAYKVFLTTNFANAAFKSCQNVRIPATGGFAISTMCGRYGAKLCTPQYWYDFQGNSGNGLAPLDIDFNLLEPGHDMELPPGVIPYDGKVLGCNESSVVDGEVCSCQDCTDSCPYIPPPKVPPGPFKVGDLDGALFVSIILFVVLLLAFLLCVPLSSYLSPKKQQTKSKKKKKDSGQKKEKQAKDQNSNNILERRIDPSEVTCAEKNSMAAQDFLSSVFEVWGTTMAKYPLWVSVTEKPFQIY